jgi:hypothetical protein
MLLTVLVTVTVVVAVATTGAVVVVVTAPLMPLGVQDAPFSGIMLTYRRMLYVLRNAITAVPPVATPSASR